MPTTTTTDPRRMRAPMDPRLAAAVDALDAACEACRLASERVDETETALDAADLDVREARAMGGHNSPMMSILLANLTRAREEYYAARADAERADAAFEVALENRDGVLAMIEREERAPVLERIPAAPQRNARRAPASDEPDDILASVRRARQTPPATERR